MFYHFAIKLSIFKFILKLLKDFSFVSFVLLRFENNFMFFKKEIMVISINDIVRNNGKKDRD